MFYKMVKVFMKKLDNGNDGYEWNCDAEDFYNAMYEMALAGIITDAQWKLVTDFIETNVN